MPEAWYAVYTRFQHEKSAARLLENKNIEVFLPIYRTSHRWKDRNKTVVLPLFPCYTFVRIDLERKLDVLRTVGVRWLVENAGHACPVPGTEIETVRRVCSSGSRVQPHPFLRQGDLVRIRTGVLEGTEGILARAKNESRVVIAVGLLQKSVAVEVELWNVEVVAPASKAKTTVSGMALLTA